MGKLNLHLPTSDDDPMKNKVTNMLHDYLKDVFEMAKYAMVVDGVDLGSKKANGLADLLSLRPKEKTEPFDFELNSKLREILQDIEHETVEVTSLRKQIPGEFKQRYGQVVAEIDEEVSTFLSALEKNNDNDNEPNNNDNDNNGFNESFNDFNDKTNGKLDDMLNEYETHLIQLNQLKSSIPKQKAEIQTINELITFLEEKYAQDSK